MKPLILGDERLLESYRNSIMRAEQAQDPESARG